MRLLAIAVCLFLIAMLVGCAAERFLTAEQDAAVAYLCGPPLGCEIRPRTPGLGI